MSRKKKKIEQNEQNEAAAPIEAIEPVETVTVEELMAAKPKDDTPAEAPAVSEPAERAEDAEPVESASETAGAVEAAETIEIVEIEDLSESAEPAAANEPEAPAEPEESPAASDLPPAAANEPMVYETTEDILREGGTGELAVQRPKRQPSEYVRMCGSLVVICALVALVVSFVHAMTADIIAAAAEREKQAAIMRIFGEGVEASQIDPLEGIAALYAVEDEGYCVNLAAGGFGGNIEMMVGVNTDGSLRGVEIVSLSETPGLGSKVKDAGYLEQYVGQRGTLTLGGEISAISGATISSRAVLKGVNDALLALQNAGLIGGAGQ